MGPVKLEKLEKLLSDGTLDGSSLVAEVGSAEWCRLDSIILILMKQSLDVPVESSSTLSDKLSNPSTDKGPINPNCPLGTRAKTTRIIP